MNSEKGIEAANFLNSLIQDGYANIDPMKQEFHNGKCATMLGGSWEVATDVYKRQALSVLQPSHADQIPGCGSGAGADSYGGCRMV